MLKQRKLLKKIRTLRRIIKETAGGSLFSNGGKIFGVDTNQAKKLYDAAKNGNLTNVVKKAGKDMVNKAGEQVVNMTKEGVKKLNNVLDSQGQNIVKEASKKLSSAQSIASSAGSYWTWIKVKYHVLMNKLIVAKDRILATLFKGGYSKVGTNVVDLVKQTSKEAYAVYKQKGILAALKFLFTDELFDVLLIIIIAILVVTAVYALYKVIVYAYGVIKKYFSDEDSAALSKASKKIVMATATKKTEKPGMGETIGKYARMLADYLEVLWQKFYKKFWSHYSLPVNLAVFVGIPLLIIQIVFGIISFAIGFVA